MSAAKTRSSSGSEKVPLAGAERRAQARASRAGGRNKSPATPRSSSAPIAPARTGSVQEVIESAQSVSFEKFVLRAREKDDLAMKIGKIRRRCPKSSTFDMTPMIDVCFQLIIFFMLSLKLFSPEGDFSIKMPLATSEGPPPIDQLPPIKLVLTADSNGKLAGLTMGTKQLSSKDPFNELRREIRTIIKDDIGPGTTGSKQEVELDCDPHLHYQYVMQTITAVSGFTGKDAQGQRQIVKLIEKIKFSPRRKG